LRRFCHRHIPYQIAVKPKVQRQRRVKNATFTADEKQKEELTCSASLNTGIHGQSDQLTFNAVLNGVLSITALLGNSLILIALRKQSSLRPSSKLLLRSSATTDLCVGFFSEPLYITLLVTIVHDRWTICGHVLVGVSVTSFIL